jgi:hypothetical protein
MMRTDDMHPLSPQQEIEEQICMEFRDAFDELKRAPEREKAEAAERLHRAVRRLYDVVGSGRVPVYE